MIKTLLACLLAVQVVGQTPTPKPKPKPAVHKVKAKKPRTVLPEPILEYLDVLEEMHTKEEIFELCKTKSPYYMYRFLSEDLDNLDKRYGNYPLPYWCINLRKSLEDWGRNLTVE